MKTNIDKIDLLAVVFALFMIAFIVGFHYLFIWSLMRVM
jgi:hypothetical protein